MPTRPFTATLAVIALAALAACSTSPRNDDRSYGGAPTQGYGYGRPAVQSDRGVVRAIDIVPVSSSRPAGAGAIIGAIVGGVVGNQFGSGGGRAATTIGGAAAGALAGHAVEKRTRKDDEVYRVSVRFEDGSIRDYDYQRIDDLRVGDRVRLVNGQLHYLE